MLGAFGAELALFPHGPRSPSMVDTIERTADDVLMPLTGTTLRSAIADYAAPGGLELEGDGLAVSDESALRLRGANGGESELLLFDLA
jgi:hypothetical protein